MIQDIKRFVNHYDKMPSDFILSLEAGYVTRDGCITGGQKGAIDTFCVGMPVYNPEGEMLGRLEVDLFEHLNYTDRTEEEIEIPVEFWKIKDYDGPLTSILTYYQAKDMGLMKKKDEGKNVE